MVRKAFGLIGLIAWHVVSAAPLTCPKVALVEWNFHGVADRATLDRYRLDERSITAGASAPELANFYPAEIPPDEERYTKHAFAMFLDYTFGFPSARGSDVFAHPAPVLLMQFANRTFPQALERAMKAGVRIVSLSIGAHSQSRPDLDLEALDELILRHPQTLFVVASGYETYSPPGAFASARRLLSRARTSERAAEIVASSARRSAREFCARRAPVGARSDLVYRWNGRGLAGLRQRQSRLPAHPNGARKEALSELPGFAVPSARFGEDGEQLGDRLPVEILLESIGGNNPAVGPDLVGAIGGQRGNGIRPGRNAVD